MTEIVDLDELVPEDITFKYRGTEYTIPGDLRTDQTLDLFALLKRLATVESKGTAAELKQIMEKVQKALLPIFQTHQPDMVELPFGAAGLGLVLQRLLVLIGLLEVAPVPPEGDAVDPSPAPNRAARRARRPASSSTPKTTKRGSDKRSSVKRSAGSSRSSS